MPPAREGGLEAPRSRAAEAHLLDVDPLVEPRLPLEVDPAAGHRCRCLRRGDEPPWPPDERDAWADADGDDGACPAPPASLVVGQGRGHVRPVVAARRDRLELGLL